MTTCRANNDPWKHFDINNRCKLMSGKLLKLSESGFLSPTPLFSFSCDRQDYTWFLRFVFFFSDRRFFLQNFCISHLCERAIIFHVFIRHDDLVRVEAFWWGLFQHSINPCLCCFVCHLFGFTASSLPTLTAFIPGGLLKLEGTLPVASATAPARVAPSHGMP